MVKELAEYMPSFKTTLLDERDMYMVCDDDHRLRPRWWVAGSGGYWAMAFGGSGGQCGAVGSGMR